MNNLKVLILFLSFFIISCDAHSWRYVAAAANGYSSSTSSTYNQNDYCIKYKLKSGFWSKGYSVDLKLYKGTALNSATNSYNYNSYSTYAVVFWNNNSATIIELDYYYGSLGAAGTNGTDQKGRRWEVSKTSYCY